MSFPNAERSNVGSFDENYELVKAEIDFMLTMSVEEAIEIIEEVGDDKLPATAMSKGYRDIKFKDVAAKNPKVLIYILSECKFCTMDTRVIAMAFVTYGTSLEKKFFRRVRNEDFLRIARDGLKKRSHEILKKFDVEAPAVIATGSIEVVEEIDADIVADVPEVIGSENGFFGRY